MLLTINTIKKWELTRDGVSCSGCDAEINASGYLFHIRMPSGDNEYTHNSDSCLIMFLSKEKKSVLHFTEEQEKEGSFVRDYDKAFRNAIDAKMFTMFPDVFRKGRCVNDWMYMYSKILDDTGVYKGVDIFKHKETKEGLTVAYKN